MAMKEVKAKEKETATKRKHKNRISVNQMLNYKPKEVKFDGEWRDLVGDPEIKGAWIIFGQSGAGKSRFAAMLTKYFADKGVKVAYVSLEEGRSKSFLNTIKETGLVDCTPHVELWYDMDIATIKAELSRRCSPSVVIIDSLQYTGINYAGYKKFKEDLPSKLFIFISHANERNMPSGATATKILYDSNVKILVRGFMAYAKSRFGGNQPFTIWKEGAAKNAADNNDENPIKSI